MKFTLRLLALASSVLLAGAQSPQRDAYALVSEMLERTQQIQTVSYTQKKWERIDGEMYYEKIYTKLRRNPFQVYVKVLEPNDRIELLYKEGWNDGEVKISLGEWLPTLNFAPNNSRMRKQQHHSIRAAGFDHLYAVLTHLREKYGEQAREMTQYDGRYTWNGHTCEKVTLKTPQFRYRPYTCKPGEDLCEIADKYKISDYKLLKINDGVSDYDDLEAGQKIQITSEYGTKTVLLIDTKTKLPLKVKVYDERGLYERYEMYGLRVNPSLSPAAFDPDNENYHF